MAQLQLQQQLLDQPTLDPVHSMLWRVLPPRIAWAETARRRLMQLLLLLLRWRHCWGLR
jgi:hypothetical protein